MSNSKTSDNPRRPVLGLFAHPDDETFGPGSTLAMLAHSGHPVHIVCATRGEAGTIGDSASYGRARLAEVREKELHAACATLGAHPPRILFLPDGGLHRLEDVTLVRPFVRAIREIRPEAMITFHEGGISGHRDHQTVTARARQAYDLAGDAATWPDLGPPHEVERLWAYCIPESYAARIRSRRMIAVPDAELDAVLDVSGYIRYKRQAVADHATQKPFIDWLEQQMGGLDERWKTESFVLDRARVGLDGRRPVGELF